MPTITIQGTPIDFPNTSASPDWSEAVIEFASAVEDALSSAVGAYDIAPQVFTLDNSHDASTTELPNLSFATSTVRAAEINIAVYRTATSVHKSEMCKLFIVYNENGSPDVWEMSREGVGDASIEFTISSTGQVSFTTTTIGGSNHTGLISYSAKSLLNS